MSLTNCPECSKELSIKADSCLHCNSAEDSDLGLDKENYKTDGKNDKEQIMLSWSKKFFLNKDGEIRVECLGVVIAFIFFLCRALWYIYISGMFAAYKINDIYIEVSGENIVFKTILGMTFIGVFLITNYLCYYVIVTRDKMRIRLFLLFIINFSTSLGFSIILFIQNSFVGFPFRLISVLILIILLMFFSHIINLYGIMLGIMIRYDKGKAKRFDKKLEKIKKNKEKNKKVRKKEKKKKKKEKTKRTDMNLILVLICCVLIFQILLTYGVGYRTAFNKKFFDTIDNKYVILFENKENYIVANYREENGYIKDINYNQKTVLSKLDREIIRKNVYEEDDVQEVYHNLDE